jgi:hypothetical protein
MHITSTASVSPALEWQIVSYLAELTKRDLSYKREVEEREKKTDK